MDFYSSKRRIRIQTALSTIVLFVCHNISLGQVPVLNLLKQTGGAGIDLPGDVLLENSGNIYNCGTFTSTIDLNPGAGTASFTSNGGKDLYLQKLDISGNYVWGRRIGGIEDESTPSIAADNAGNIYIAGSFSGSVDFDPTSGTDIYSSTFGSEDCFIVKLNAAGNYLWTKTFGGPASDSISDIAFDTDNNRIIMCGSFQSSVDFDPGIGVDSKTSNGSTDIFILALNDSGLYLWAKTIGDFGPDEAKSIAINPFASNIHIAGKYTHTVDFDPDAGTQNLTSAGSSDIFVLKMDNNGNYIWARSFGGSNADEVYSINVDASSNITTTGLFFGTSDFDPGAGNYPLTSAGQSDIFINKISSFGNFQWARSYGGPGNDAGMDLTSDASGNVYTVGYFEGDVDFDFGAGTTLLSSNGNSDYFAQKLSTSGNFLWAFNSGGADDETGVSITNDNLGYLYVSGTFESGTIDLAPGAATSTLTNFSTTYDAFFQRLTLCPLTTSETVSHVSCNGGSDASINLSVASGIAPYNYDWGGGINTQNRTGLSAGTYTCVVTASNGCTTTSTVTITEPSAIAGNATPTATTCNGGTNGSIDLEVTGGTGGYTYNWGTPGTTQDISGLAAGTYTCTITDANGCSATVNSTVNQPTALDVSSVITNVACNAGTNGGINLTVTGGTAPYSYNWGSGFTTEDLTAVAAGTYICTITDANVCTITAMVTVNEPTVLAATTATTDLTCNGNASGAINLTVNGGTAPYTYAWTNSQTTEDLTAIAAGTYSCTITDANTCTVTVSTTVNEPAAITATFVETQPTCNGGSNGALGMTVSNGTAPYTYAWTNSQTTEDLTAIAAGTYSCTITDANSCTVTVSTTVNEPAAITAAFAATQPTCNGGSNGALGMTVSNGTAPYTYAWTNSQTTEDLTAIAAGTYSCTITDANSCTATVNATLNEPAAITAAFAATQPTCNGGSNGALGMTVNGGTAPYTYAWTNSQTTEDLTGIAAGTYSCTITDANSCTATVSATVNEPTVVAGTTSVTQPTCFGGDGAVDMTVTGGSAPYTYNWGPAGITQNLSAVPAGTYSCTITDANNCTGVATATIIDPAAITSSFNDDACGSYTWNNVEYTVSGPYEQVFTSVEGCDSTVTLNLTIHPVLNMTASDNGSLLITASTASTYQWINCADNAPIAGATSATFAPTANGSYAVIGTSADGCTDISNCVEIDYVALNENALNNISVYPNPTNGNVTIAFDHAQEATLVITDAKGTVVKTQLVQNGETVSIEQFENGIYFFSIQQANNHVIQRIVKQ